MSKLKHKELELEKAINDMKQASSSVKQLSADVKNGLVPKSKLEDAIDNLKKQGGNLKIIHAEAKILSGYESVTFNDIAPSNKKNNIMWSLIALIALGYLVTH
jgi:hypothetical protein